MKKLIFFLCITMSIFANCNTVEAHKTNTITEPDGEVSKLTIKKDQDGHLIAIPQNMKGLQNVVFVLQTKEIQKNFETIELVNCSVNYQKNYVQFTTSTKSITFKLDNVAINLAKNATVYQGFGVVKIADPKAYSAYLGAINDPNPLPLVPLACHCVPNGGGGVRHCDSGGAGSNQCSIEGGIDTPAGGASGGCSVSCNSGSYSCCNAMD